MKKLYLIAFVLLLISCKNTLDINNDLESKLEVLINVSKEDGYSDYMYVYLFKEGMDKRTLVYFDIDELRRLYFGKHIESITSKLTFEEFIRGVLHNKIILKNNIFGESFEKNNGIENEYRLIGFKKFKEKYTFKTLSDNEILLDTKNLTEEEILNVIYVFYLNGYFTIWGDYEGFYISNNEVVIKEKEKPLIEYF